MTDFDRANTFVARWEGGLADVVGDRGGRTNYGITQSTYNRWRAAQKQPAQDVAQITREEAEAIFHAWYWQPVAAAHPWPLNAVLYDTSVHSGPGKARELLSRAQAQTGSSDPAVLARAVVTLRAAFLERLAHQPQQGQFRKGWANRMAALKAFIATPVEKEVEEKESPGKESPGLVFRLLNKAGEWETVEQAEFVYKGLRFNASSPGVVWVRPNS